MTRRLTVTFALVITVAAVALGSAFAATTAPVSGSGTGTFVVTFGVPPGSPPGAFDTITENGNYTSSGVLGTGSYHIEGFVFLSGLNVTFSGTATLARSDGATLSGTMTGGGDLAGTFVTYTLNLTTGTGPLVSAQLDLSGRLGPFTATPTGSTAPDTFTFTGTVTATLTPPNKDACKNGGWRIYVDDHGQPFPNQGQCVSWACITPQSASRRPTSTPSAYASVKRGRVSAWPRWRSRNTPISAM